MSNIWYDFLEMRDFYVQYHNIFSQAHIVWISSQGGITLLTATQLQDNCN